MIVISTNTILSTALNYSSMPSRSSQIIVLSVAMIKSIESFSYLIGHFLTMYWIDCVFFLHSQSGLSLNYP